MDHYADTLPLRAEFVGPQARGFSLIELVIVVVIIGIIGAIAIPRLSSGASRSKAHAFVSEINAIAAAVERYKDAHGVFPEEQGGKAMPPEVLAEFRTGALNDMPYGGEWLYEDKDDEGIRLFAKFEDNPGDELFIELDRLLDDGDLDTGVFIKKDGDEVYLIIR